MADTVARPQVEITAVDSTKAAFDAVKRGLGDIKTSAGDLRGTFASLATAVTVGAFAATIKSATDYGEALAKSSEKTGLAVESFAKLQYAARLADVDNTALAKGLKGLAGNIYDNDKAFQALGISTRNSSGQIRGTDDVVGDLAEAFSKMEDGAGKSALAVRLFGKAGADLIPLLNGGRQGLKDAGDEAQRFGLVLSGDSAKRFQEFNDNLKRLGALSEAGKLQLLESLLPALQSISTELIKGRELFGGYGKALLELATINPFRGIGDNIKVVTAELDELIKREKAFADFGEKAPASLAKSIESEKKRLEFLKLQQRNSVNQIDDPSLDETARRFRAPAIKKNAAPDLPDDSLLKRQAEIFAQMLQSANELVIKTGDLTRFQEVSAELDQKKFSFLTRAQRDELLSLAAKADLVREDVRVQKEADDAVKKSLSDANERLLKEADARNKVADAIKGELDPLIELGRQLTEIADLAERGLLSEEQAADATAKRYETAGKQLDELANKYDPVISKVKETNDLGHDFGLIFKSAFEDAVVSGKSLREVVAGLTADLAKMFLRKGVTEPLGNAVGDFFKTQSGGGDSQASTFFQSIFGGARAAGGAVSRGRAYLVGEKGPEMFFPGSNGSIAASSSGGGDNHFNFNFAGGEPTDPKSFLAAVVPTMKAIAQGTLMTALRPGGALAGR